MVSEKRVPSYLPIAVCFHTWHQIVTMQLVQ
jgi:hypothetical protein